MRRIGEIQEAPVGQRFLNFLAVQGIEGELRENDEQGYSIWILDDDQIEEAQSVWTDYLRQPQDQRFDAPAAPKSKVAPSRAEYIDVRKQIFSRSSGMQAVTMSFIALSVLVTLMLSNGVTIEWTRWLYFSEYYGRDFPEIMSGQFWRMFTPIFIHSGILHIVFNMLWLYQLGGMVERQEGPRYALVMILAFGALCNTAQYLVSGPLFGGMSGVTYGLLGYIWMMSRYAARQYFIQQQTVVFMVIWLVICLVGIIPNVANTQHVIGFLSGTAFGFFRSGGFKVWRRRQDYKRRL